MIDGRALCEAMGSYGIRRAFGVPGTQTLGLFDALRSSEIRFTLAAHELGAAFMANGFYRASGQLAVVVTIGGPGFTNALTGIAEARLDSIGLLHVVNAPATEPGQKFQLQSIDQAAIAAPLVKGVFDLGPEDDANAVVGRAIARAIAGEPGPVLIQVAGRGGSAGPTEEDSPADPAAPVAPLLDRLGELWQEAERPVLLLGQGAAAETARIRRIVDGSGIPVVTTPSARGLVPEDHPVAMGYDVLRGGTERLNRLFERADLILALGCKLGHNGSAGFRFRLPEERLVRVDTARPVLDANYPAALSIESKAGVVLAYLEEMRGPERRAAWTDAELAEIRAGIRELSPSVPDPVIPGPGFDRASGFFGWLRQVLPRDAILVTDSGMHQILARRHFDVLSERGFLLPSDYQSMGFGIPAAIGAKLAAPHRPVVALTGDGGLLMAGMEITTAVRDHIPLLVIVFNDGYLNQIRVQQLKDTGRAFGTSLASFDHQKFAEATGARHLLLDSGTRGADLRIALEQDGPTILEVRVGDSWGMRAEATTARLKEAVRTVRDASSGLTGRNRR